MDIKTGLPVSGPASTSSVHPGVAPETARVPALIPHDPGDQQAADTVGQQLARAADGRDAAAAAQDAAHAAEAGRRDHYETDMNVAGPAEYGDLLALPDVVSDSSKHTAGSDATAYDPAS